MSTYRWFVRCVLAILVISVSRGHAQSLDDYTRRISDASVGGDEIAVPSSGCADPSMNTPAMNTPPTNMPPTNMPRSCQENLQLADTGSPQFVFRPPVSVGTVSAETLRHALSEKALRSLQKAVDLIQAGDHRRALHQLREAAKISSAAPIAYGMLGQEYLRLREPGEAIPELQKAVSLLPANVPNRANLGLALLMTGESQAAEQELRKALHLDHENPHTQMVLGIALLTNGTNEAEGVGYLRFAGRSLSAAHIALGAFYARSGQMDAANQEALAFLGPDRSSNPALVRNWIELIARKPGTLAEVAYGVSQ